MLTQTIVAGNLWVNLPRLWGKASLEENCSQLRMMITWIKLYTLTKRKPVFKAAHAFEVFFAPAGLTKDA